MEGGGAQTQAMGRRRTRAIPRVQHACSAEPPFPFGEVLENLYNASERQEDGAYEGLLVLSETE